jgi:ABC-2 type transport system permease protein
MPGETREPGSLFLLLFNYVFGGAVKRSVTIAGSHDYVDYLLPGLLIMTAASQLICTSTSTSVDWPGDLHASADDGDLHAVAPARPGAVERDPGAGQHGRRVRRRAADRPLPPRQSAPVVSRGRVLGVPQLRAVLAGSRVRPGRQSVASASNGPFPLVLLPLVGSWIVPPKTMPTAVRYFAQYEPFTPMIDTVRSLLFGTHVGENAVIALAWATGRGVLGGVWSIRSFTRERPERPS